MPNSSKSFQRSKSLFKSPMVWSLIGRNRKKKKTMCGALGCPMKTIREPKIPWSEHRTMLRIGNQPTWKFRRPHSIPVGSWIFFTKDRHMSHMLILIHTFSDSEIISLLVMNMSHLSPIKCIAYLRVIVPISPPSDSRSQSLVESRFYPSSISI